MHADSVMLEVTEAEIDVKRGLYYGDMTMIYEVEYGNCGR
jgi:hypothetical protein